MKHMPSKKAWPSANRLLKQAIARLRQTAIGSQKLSSFGLKPKSEQLLVKDRSIIGDTLDAVGKVFPRAFGSL